MIERVTFPSATGDTAQGALAVPAGAGRAPAVILVHEWWGLTDQIEHTAERLAEAGFVALAVDLYRGFVTRDPAEAQRQMVALPRERSLADLRGAVAYLHDHDRATGKVAITGFCMGGAYAVCARRKSMVRSQATRASSGLYTSGRCSFMKAWSAS